MRLQWREVGGEGWREGGRERGSEGDWKGGREGGKERGRDQRREEWWEGGRKGEREREREGGSHSRHANFFVWCMRHHFAHQLMLTCLQWASHNKSSAILCFEQAD